MSIQPLKTTTVAVIGAGPAGIAAAIQLQRFAVQCIIFEKDQPGGLLRNANMVENYPGFPNGITGPRLVNLLNEHVYRNRFTLIHQNVTHLKYREDAKEFSITCANGESYRASIVIVASGTRPRLSPLVEALPDPLKKYIYYEIFPIVGEWSRHILVVGGGDAAFDYALNLSASNRVVIANRSGSIRALPVLVDRVNSNDTVTYYDNAPVKSIGHGDKKKLSVTLDMRTGFKTMEFDYALFAIGRDPEKAFYHDGLLPMIPQLKLREIFYEIGDVANGMFRQTSIAVGNGVEAAMRIHEHLLRR